MTGYADIETRHEVWALLLLMEYGICVGPMEILRQRLRVRDSVQLLQPRIERAEPQFTSQILWTRVANVETYHLFSRPCG